VKIATLIMVVGAAIAFAAPMANASSSRAVPHHKVTTHGKTHKVIAHQKGGGNVSAKPPLYIFVPGFSGTPSATTDPTELCLQSMENCTDQQLCDNWSINCSTAGATVSAGPAASVSLPAVGAGALLVATESNTAESTPAAAASSSSTSNLNDDEDC
jgi:hypothetical protein